MLAYTLIDNAAVKFLFIIITECGLITLFEINLLMWLELCYIGNLLYINIKHCVILPVMLQNSYPLHGLVSWFKCVSYFDDFFKDKNWLLF